MKGIGKKEEKDFPSASTSPLLGLWFLASGFLFRVPLLLQLHRLFGATLRAVLLDFKFLPPNSFAVLLMQADAPDSVSRFGAEHPGVR